MLVKCPECGREISSEALSCPHCGYPINKNIAEQKSADEDKMLLKQYTEEFNSYASATTVCVTIGFLFIIIGVTMLVLGLTLDTGYEYIFEILMYVFLPLGLIIAIVGGAVNSTKAGNRKKEIERLEIKLGDINEKEDENK